ncbi:MAG: branched-chain amino acid ABC transporter permease [Spirochaetaceae bacterium]|nr:branched-chain amino acid ABC transporter permease [Spirochaetaceae bacterium]
MSGPRAARAASAAQRAGGAASGPTQARPRPTAKSAAGTLLAAAVLAGIPLFGNSYHLHVACLFGIIVISAVGLNLLTGYAGLISLGHAAFMGVGAYGVAWFSANLALPFYLCLPLAGLLAAGAGMATGLPSLRIRGLYLAIATLAAQFILGFVFNAWEPVTGGRGGTNVAPAQIAGLQLSTEREMYYPIAAVAVAALLFTRNLFRTRAGRAFVAMRDRDSAAEVLGVDPRRYQLAAFAASSFFAGIAGGFMAYFYKVVTPGQFGFQLSLFYLTAIVVGGMGTVQGVLLGAIFMTATPAALAAVAGMFGPLAAGLLAPLREVLFGLLIVLFLIFEPGGLAGIINRITKWIQTQRRGEGAIG